MDPKYMFRNVLRGVVRDLATFLSKSELDDEEKEMKQAYVEDAREQIIRYFSESTVDDLKSYVSDIADHRLYASSLLESLAMIGSTKEECDDDKLRFKRHVLCDLRRDVDSLIVSLRASLEACDIAEEELKKLLPESEFGTQGIAKKLN